MLWSFRFWSLLAALLSGVTCLIHVFLGGPELHELGLASDLPAGWKAVFSVLWHSVTATLALNSLFLGLVVLPWRRNQLLLAILFALNAAFACLFVFYGWVRLGTLTELPQWTLFVTMSALIGVAMLVRERSADVGEQPVPSRSALVLPGSDFSDSYSARSHGTLGTAVDAAQHMFSRPPAWVRSFLTLRNAIAAPFGLITSETQLSTRPMRIGMFPIISQEQNFVVLGLDDKHLDFRVVVSFDEQAREVQLTTLVKTHNVFGRIYLAVVKPFHKLIVPSMLARVAA